VAPDQHVVEHGEAAEEADVLEGASQPQPRALVRREIVERRVVEADATGVGGQDPAHAVEQGRLARAVGADQGVDGAGLDHEVDAVQDSQTTERFRDAAQLE
jgi:hypothetical protein